ncbi:transcriptional regulator [Candidatus Campbellbacteria bacterium CG11_big_fil_rev_8_21_14_0_20_44_21]|uniref:Transcriptional regulator n=1 Tax=Candidatus Campbellbacteria bacterium CG22_combo_CG10-13_8_21_14_all_43_18 TaxID=1974530 RepID=A0A2H0DWV9_9BACT|nr:MAG: transcriptional regulator [Candidatus Campbellbacteria bacterium CG22_combo_CG10-13_8_21_14_all_43_18]PIR24481.1 MAG: transcriptional regulator [Candidatus Campbellbacteria bacterium CG11_big_fil_rev_8_21_14_0_20_44_21]
MKILAENSRTARAIETFKILSSGTRFKIVTLLMKAGRDLCVNEIAEAIGMSHSATSHQLAKLEDKGIVRSFRMGQMICYEIERSAVTGELLTVVDQFIHK